MTGCAQTKRIPDARLSSTDSMARVRLGGTCLMRAMASKAASMSDASTEYAAVTLPNP
jgi:hypothetical protein